MPSSCPTAGRREATLLELQSSNQTMFQYCKLLIPIMMIVTGANSMWASYMLLMTRRFASKSLPFLRRQLAALSILSKWK